MRRPAALPSVAVPLIIGLVSLPVVTVPSHAQLVGEIAPIGAVQGTVLDATSSAPLAGAHVTITPRGGDGALAPMERGGVFANARTTTTSRGGAYRFGNLPAGEYTLLVRRVGYDAQRIEIGLAGPGDTRVSIGLVVQPVRLHPVSVLALRDSTAPGQSLTADDGARRIEAARERQRAFLSTDVREVTVADIYESATMGSGDVLRAMHPLPSVDPVGGAGMSVRGASWSQTRVYFDGIPLFDPVSGMGTISGVGALSAAGVFLHPGVRPVSLGGEGAARVDIHSPTGIADGKVHGSGEASSVALSGSLAMRAASGRAGFHVAGRRDMSGLIGPDGRDAAANLRRVYAMPPMARFGDMTARGDMTLGASRLEASAIIARDRRLSMAEWQGLAWMPADSVHRRTTGARIAVHHPAGRFATSTSASVTRHDQLTAKPTPLFESEPEPTPDPLPTESIQSSISQFTIGTRIGSRDSIDRQGWAAGADLVAYKSRYSAPRRRLVWGDPSPDEMSARDALTFASLWGERRWVPAPRLEVEVGVRADVGGGSLPTVRPAPSLIVRSPVSPATGVSLAAGRVHQYAQQLGRPWGTDGPWLLPGSDAPLLRIDYVTAGIEHWHATGNLLAANLYSRRAGGAAISDPLPGDLVDRPLFTEGTETAVGVELSARKLAGRTTGLVAYRLSRARTSDDGYRFPANGDRTHAIDATAMARLGRWRLGGSFAFLSGAPYTLLYQVMPIGRDPALGWETPPRADDTNAQREHGTARLDLLGDWTFSLHSVDVTTFAAVQNVLFRSTGTPVAAPASSCPARDGVICTESPGSVRRRMVPSAGIRIRF